MANLTLANLDADLRAGIEAFVLAADAAVKAHWERNKYTFSPPPTHRADVLSDKWVRVVTLEWRNGVQVAGSSHSFIALQDFATKNLGQIRRGDVHKPASFKAPARHARGNVFNQSHDQTLTPFGVAYMRQ